MMTRVESSPQPQFWFICSIFLAANLIMATVNHIDDTDETYGYFEPLHYLLYGTGMQTWEYAPQYAIRTYTFLSPFWGIGLVLKSLNFSKLNIFYGIRTLLGSMTAFSEASFISSVYRMFGTTIGAFTFIFILFSSGILYCSTALLPSAIIMSLVMIASSSWMDGHYTLTVFVGCISVLWSGWPFIGIMFVPLGLHMLVNTYRSHDNFVTNTESDAIKVEKKESWRVSVGTRNVLVLSLRGACILVAVAASAAAIDFRMYNRRTSPTWNILAYNAIGGNGDELYGIESASYYIRNLVLNMNVSWPLAVAAPVLLLREYVYGFSIKKIISKGTLFLPAIIWLCVLFSRPHKEERFLYPVYPLLAFMAAFSLSTIIEVICGIVSEICGENKEHPKTVQSVKILNDELHTSNTVHVGNSRNDDGNSSQKMKEENAVSQITIGRRTLLAKRLLTGACMTATFLLCLSRTASNFVNYSGYISLWTLLNDEIEGYNNLDKTYNAGVGGRASFDDKFLTPLTVCMGGEWYTFPSHFFLPKNVRLEYIRGSFHGQLPQHFSTIGGTSGVPLQQFNDLNKEEESRYVPLNSCDYLVAIIESGTDKQSELEDDNRNETEEVKKVGRIFQFKSERIDEIPNVTNFKYLFSSRIIDAFKSQSVLARAYFIPGVSGFRNSYNSYTAFKKKS